MAPRDEPAPDLAFLRVDLDELARHGHRQRAIRGALPVPFLQAALAGTDATVSAPAEVRLEVFVQPDGVVLARGRLEGGFVVPCGRCLEDARVDAGQPICATFLPPGKRPAASGFDEGLSEEDLDVYGYTPPIVDLTEVVREHWAVAYPMRALCGRGEACRGLCGRCGEPLNALAEAAPACPSCGGALREVSQRPADRDRPGGEAAPATGWKAALAGLAASLEDE